jgi:DNA replication and repair protein RecF
MYLADPHLTENSSLPRQSCVRPEVKRLVLHDFRSYACLDLSIDHKMIALIGENGAGKTNLLEALSLFCPGRGLRRADLGDFPRVVPGQETKGGFAVFAEIATGAFKVQLGTGVEPLTEGLSQRRCRIDREPKPSLRAFADHVRVLWLTPAMDGLFAGPAGERRRFLDRLVLSIDAEHGARVSGFERALRNRNKLLEQGSPDRSSQDRIWCDAAEHEIAELGVAVAAARVETISRLRALIFAAREELSPFPWADIALKGEIEQLVSETPALAAEESYRTLLRQNRARDAAAGRCLIGPQASDLVVRHGPKQIEGAKSSTGEQKALLTGLVLAHARLVADISGIAPLILLDEIAAHFDSPRRLALFEALEKLAGQVWLTGADPAALEALSGRAQILKVSPGQVHSNL